MQAVRAGVGQRPAKAEQKTQVEQLSRLFRAAGKAVHNAAQARLPAYRQDHFLHRTSGMDDDG